MQNKIQSMNNTPILTHNQIQICIQSIAEKITATYPQPDNLVGIEILDGATRFTNDLVKLLPFHLHRVPIKVSSYHGGTESTGKCIVEGSLPVSLTDKDVLVLDDIYDSGRTMACIIHLIQKQNPKSCEPCVLLEKKVPHVESLTLNFPRLLVPDKFLIGYGLDYQGKYRELDDIIEFSGTD
ncbi:MAG: hypoxanthine phosphoribosyltransferase [Fibrobacteria bacterium]|nr:hypoxanthine phosphoribosyltransferase [Fibrobacteria bacterium]